MSVTHIQQAAEKRRSIYALNKQLPVPAADIIFSKDFICISNIMKRSCSIFILN